MCEEVLTTEVNDLVIRLQPGWEIRGRAFSNILVPLQPDVSGLNR